MIDKFPSEKELTAHLRTHGVNVSDWGQGKAKTVTHLLQEIREGETSLTEADGALFRHVRVACADVLHADQILREEKQVFNDGRERRRDMDQSVSEKFKSGEDPTEAIIRGIREELQIDGDVDVVFQERKEQIIDSPSYPSLKTRYEVYEHLASLTDEQYKPEGYVEEQPDKSTFFVWEDRSSS